MGYLASLAEGRAWESAWLVWWWSPEGRRSSRPDQTLLWERRDRQAAALVALLRQPLVFVTAWCLRAMSGQICTRGVTRSKTLVSE